MYDYNSPMTFPAVAYYFPAYEQNKVAPLGACMVHALSQTQQGPEGFHYMVLLSVSDKYVVQMLKRVSID